MKLTNTLLSLIFLAITLIHAFAYAEEEQPPAGAVESNSISEVWLNAGFYSYHFDHGQNLNDKNIGLGVEYRYSTVSALTAGSYLNSDRRDSRYAALVWEPLLLGRVRIGGLVGVLNGYPRAYNGGWIPVILPAASLEYKNFGWNLTIIPTYKDIIYGSISLQLKFKMF